MDADTLKAFQEKFNQMMQQNAPEKALPQWREEKPLLPDQDDYQERTIQPDDSKGLQWSLSDFSGLVKMFSWLILALLIAWLLLRYIQSFQSKKKKVSATQSPVSKLGAANSPNPSYTLEDWAQALAQKNYPLAARLRWKSFLKAQNLYSGLTPLEACVKYKNFQAYKELSNKISGVMFGAVVEAEPTMQEWVKTLNGVPNLQV